MHTQIPERLVNYMAYDEDDNMLGTVDVTLPDLAYITETISGAGIAGSYDSPTVGHFQSLGIGLNFRALDEKVLAMLGPNMGLITCRGSIQFLDAVSRKQVKKQVKIVTDAFPKGVNLGTLNPATAMGTTTTHEVTYIKVYLDNREFIEIDKINFICRINGVDYLQEVAQHMRG